jgi:hypothetical protein
MSEPLDDSPEAPDSPPPFGSWSRTYGLVVAFFVVEVLLFSWLTWAVS